MTATKLAAPLVVTGLEIPTFIYGTAWKKERTADLVYQALKAGFRGIDTAAQPRHYNEKLVGDGIRRAIDEKIVTREQLYIQTKFTSPSGQDPDDMPYNLSQSFEDRIHTSIASSLRNLWSSRNSDETYLDCLVLHSPFPDSAQTLQAWEVFSTYVPHKIRCLGISNTNLAIVKALQKSQAVKPIIVQNRFYPGTRWDVSLRRFCKEQSMIFQSFWTFTANPDLMLSKPVNEVAREIGVLGVQEPNVLALYALVVGLGRISVLVGTTKAERMKGDMEGLRIVSEWANGEGKQIWEEKMRDFRGLIGDSHT